MMSTTSLDIIQAVKQNNSGYYGDGKEISDLHRQFGLGNNMTNLDCIEYYYLNGKRIRVALIDYKHSSTKYLSTNSDSVQVQAELAHDLGIPFFFSIPFIEPEFAIPMMYIIPITNMAANLLANPIGVWMSIQEYALFLYSLRPGQAIDHRAISLLSNQKAKYKLPNISGIDLLF